MIKPIMRDPIFLAQKSETATKEDLQVAQDLMDTLEANRTHCVGMAANMIGVLKNIIVFDNNGVINVMLNPVITKKTGEFETEEGCLSLDGLRKTIRYRSIVVKYQDMKMKPQIKTFIGWTAQIIQHEIDHLDGRII